MITQTADGTYSIHAQNQTVGEGSVVHFYDLDGKRVWTCDRCETRWYERSPKAACFHIGLVRASINKQRVVYDDMPDDREWFYNERAERMP